jgi:hypothetical protein
LRHGSVYVEDPNNIQHVQRPLLSASAALNVTSHLATSVTKAVFPSDSTTRQCLLVSLGTKPLRGESVQSLSLLVATTRSGRT